MSQSDRLFLEEASASLHQKLALKLVEGKDVYEQEIQDFEVSYVVSSDETGMQLSIKYFYLEGVLANGSQALLEKVWEGLPLTLGVHQGMLTVGVTAEALSKVDNGPDPLAVRQRAVQQLLMTRVWLLIGPLVDKLIWLRDATSAGNRNTTVVNNAAVPPVLHLQFRELEHCWIICKPDRVVVIFTIHLDDDGDVALGRAFCQEFAETNRKPSDSTLPCTFTNPKEPPADLQGLQVPTVNVGFLSLTLSDQCVRGATEERLYALAKPVMTFRNFFNFHVKNAKSYLHSRLRKRLDGWQQTMARAKRQPRKGQEVTRRTIGGKEFVPKASASGAFAPAPRG